MTTTHTGPAPVEDDAAQHGVALLKGVVVGVLVGIPLALVAVTLALWVFEDVDLGTAFVTGVWPSILIGVFFGGFAGMVAVER
jgi:hypothetical protein